jgi:parvulin-like peptidyl-prolyl isomerase
MPRPFPPPIRSLTALALVLAGLALPARAAPGPCQSGVPVVRIDSAEVGADEFAHWMLRFYGSRHAKDFVDQWVLHREAVRRGLAVSEAEIAAELESEIAIRIAGAFHGEKSEWLAELQRLGRTEGGHRTQRVVELRPWLDSTAMARVGRVVPEDFIRRDWELTYGPRGRRFDLQLIFQRILFSSPEPNTPNEIQNRVRAAEEAAVLERARNVRNRIVVGGESFEAVARELSDDDASRAFGGRTPGGWSQWGWPTSFIDALFHLAPGEVSEPMRARGGWWLVRVNDYQDTPLEQVRESILQDLIAKGPEQSEVGALQNQILSKVQWELSPELFAAEEPAEGPPLAGVIIDGEPVTRAEFARWFLAARGETMVSQFAEHWLVEKTAREKLVSISEAELEGRTDEYLGLQVSVNHKGNREAWLDSVRRTGRSEQDWRREWRERVRIDLLTEKLMLAERVVTEEMVRARWEEVYGKQGRELRARWILMRIPPVADEPGLTKERFDQLYAEVVAQRRREALSLVQRVRAGEDFATLARKHSEDPNTRELGGELPGRFRPETWPEEVGAAVLALRAGQVTEPILAARCWMIFEVTSERNAAYEDVRDSLYAELKTLRPSAADMAVWRNGLLKQSKVESLPGIYVRGE